jgi:DNA helicase-2/ATP-dependent DNA helicase PcrA
MDYMLESSLTIGDESFKRTEHECDEKMRNIVATIQREQNLIIPKPERADAIIIQGAAGSGKTSVALHRVAFLLYAQRERLGARNILIVSPNKVFSDYISGVLPELGRRNVPESGYEQDCFKRAGQPLTDFKTFF